MSEAKKPMPKNALTAFDACTKYGFAKLEAALDAIEERNRLDDRAAELPVRCWTDTIRGQSGTNWAGIEARTRPWRPMPEAEFSDRCIEAGHIDRALKRLLTGRLRSVWHVCTHECRTPGPEYVALLHAHELLKAERRCLAKDADRVFRKLTRVHKVSGYDLTSAFDWYVIQLAVLQQLGVAVAHVGPMPLSRPVVVPGVKV